MKTPILQLGGGNRISLDHAGMLYFPTIGDDGRSFEIVGNRDVPFGIKRFFFIFGEGNVGLVRGRHANRRSEFVLFNVSGKSKVKVIDPDKNEETFELNKPNEGVYLPRMAWKEMYDFTTDSVLMAVTNEYYDAKEYVRDFQQFVEEMKHGEIKDDE